MTREVILVTGEAIPSMTKEAINAAADEYLLGEDYSVRRPNYSQEHYCDALSEAKEGTGGNLIIVGYAPQIRAFMPYATQLFMVFNKDIKDRIRGRQYPLITIANRAVAECAQLRELADGQDLPYTTHVLGSPGTRLHGRPKRSA